MKKTTLYLFMLMASVSWLGINAQKDLCNHNCHSSEECLSRKVTYTNIQLVGLINGEDLNWEVSKKDLLDISQLTKEQFSAIIFPNRETVNGAMLNPTYQTCNQFSSIEETMKSGFEVVGKGSFELGETVIKNCIKTKRVSLLNEFTFGKEFLVEYAWYGPNETSPIFYLQEKYMKTNRVYKVTRDYFYDKETFNPKILSINPSPVNIEAQVSIKTQYLKPNNSYKIQITTFQGAVLKSKSVGANSEINFNMNAFSPGSYFVMLLNGEQVIEATQFVKK